MAEKRIVKPEQLQQVFQSWAAEFKANVDRLKHLIAEAHWGEIGTQREILLRSFLSDFLPKRWTVSTGFVIGTREGEISPQQDVIIWDSQKQMPFFQKGDFVVVGQAAVGAVIEVKSTLNGAKLNEALNQLHPDMFKYWAFGKDNPLDQDNPKKDWAGHIPFRAIFAYEYDIKVITVFEHLCNYYRQLFPFDAEKRKLLMCNESADGFAPQNLLDVICTLDGLLLMAGHIGERGQEKEAAYFATTTDHALSEFLFVLVASLDGWKDLSGGLLRKGLDASRGNPAKPSVMQFSSRSSFKPRVRWNNNDKEYLPDDYYWAPEEPLW